jgi:hypothetical protein
VVGNSDGTLILFMQKPISGTFPQFEPPLSNWQGIDVGSNSTPQFFDLDRDEMPDLVIGEMNGNINHFRNSGSGSAPVFELITDSLGKINVTNPNLSYYGFSIPCFGKTPDDLTFLLVGSDEGRIHLFGNIDNNLTGKFKPVDTLYQWLSATPSDTLFGWQTSPAIGHLTDLNEFDLITGNFSGGLNYITKRSAAPIIPGITDFTEPARNSLQVYPNPADREISVTFPGNHHKASSGYIFNVLGQMVLEFSITGDTRIETSDFREGIYVVHLDGTAGRFVVCHP